jgi:hypothetical protein
MGCEIERRKGPLHNVRQVIRVINSVIDDINVCFGVIDGSVTEEFTSDVGITAGQIVYIKSDGKIDLADKDAAIDFNDVLGMAGNSAAPGNPVTVVLSGKVTINLGSISDTFWLGNSGAVVTTAPTSGTILHIGRQVSPTDVLIQLQRPIKRS